MARLEAHADIIHDSQTDFYGTRLATCSSDATVKIFRLRDGQPEETPVTELRGHEGPVWEIAWAHPKYWSLLASCGYDHRVCIWRRTSESPDAEEKWELDYVYTDHTESVNSVSFSPPDPGQPLRLACGSSDESVSILEYNEEREEWTRILKEENYHVGGCNAVCWAPAALPDTPATPRLVSGGCDNSVKILRWMDPNWQHDTMSSQLEPENTHKDWVRDVAWASGMGGFDDVIATCSQDQDVIIWSRRADADPKDQWYAVKLAGFKAPIWRVSWSWTGGLLAVTAGDGQITVWKQVASRPLSLFPPLRCRTPSRSPLADAWRVCTSARSTLTPHYFRPSNLC